MSLGICMYSVKQTNKDLYLSNYLTKPNIMRYFVSISKYLMSCCFMRYLVGLFVFYISFSCLPFANVAWNAVDGIASSCG